MASRDDLKRDLAQKAQMHGLHYTDRRTGEGSRLLWSNVNARKHDSSTPIDSGIQSNIDQIMKMGKDDGTNVWRYMNAGTWFGTNAQRTVEQMMNLRPGQDVFMFDIENLGTFGGKGDNQLPWYSPTEIALGRRSINNDYTFGATQKEVSLLVRPTDDAFAHIDALLNKVKTLGSTTMSLTADERRSLNDLILYSDSDPFKNGYFKKGASGATYLDTQLRSKQAPAGFLFSPEQVKLMQRGRDNLFNFGSTADQVVSELDAVMGRTGVIGGFNSDRYDIPMMLDYIDNHLGKHVQDSKVRTALQRLRTNVEKANSLDVFQVIKTVYKDQSTMFGKNLKQADVAAAMGIDNGVAHKALDDLNTSTAIWNRLVTDHGIMKLAGRGGGAIMTGQWDSNPIKVDDRLFALSGLGGRNVGKNDGVFRVDPNTGKLAPAYDINVSPLYKNTEYRVDKIGQVELGGTKQFGMLLHNEADDLFHFIGRDSLSDLQNVVHQNLVPIDRLSPVDIPGLQSVSKMDRMRRKYDRLFSEEGSAEKLRRMYRGIDAMNAGMNNDQILEAAGYRDPKTGKRVAAHDSWVGQIRELSTRLTAERNVVEGFLGQLEASSLKGNARAEGVALGHFKRLLDNQFGRNKTEVNLGKSNDVIPIKLGDETHYITAKDNRTIEQGIKRVVGSNYPGKPPIALVRQRLLKIVDQVYIGGASGMSSSVAKEMREQIRNLREGDDYNTLATTLAGRLEQSVRYDQGQLQKGVLANKILVEDPFGVNPTRMNGLNGSTLESRLDIGNRAINNTMALGTKGWMDGGMAIGDKQLLDLLGRHDSSLQNMIEFTGARQLQSRSAKDTLSELASAFAKDDIGVGIFYDDRKKGLVMALANKADAERIFRLAPNEIINNTKVATVAIPMLDEKHNLIMPGQSRAGRLISYQKGSDYFLGSGFEMVAQQLMRSSGKIRERVAAGNVGGANSLGNFLVRNTLNSMSINNKRMSDQDDILNYDSNKSALSRWGKRGHIDVGVFAEEWFRSTYDSKTYQSKMSAMKQGKGMRFIDTLDMTEYSKFNRDVDGWLAKTKGLNVNMHSVKDGHAANAIRSTRDYRELSPLGFYNPTAGERVLKSVNYMPLEADRTRAALGNGARTSQIMNRGLVTDTFLQATQLDNGGNEMGYLNLRSAYMDNSQLANLMKEKLGDVDPIANTYEGVFVMADDAAKGFHMKREKKVKIAGEMGDVIDKRLLALFASNGTKDANGNILLEGLTEDERDISRLLSQDRRAGSVTKGQYSVGNLMRDGKVRESYYYNSHGGRALVKGFDTEKNSLIFEEISQAKDGSKFVTASGERLTMVTRSRDWFTQMGLEGVDTIMPGTSVKRGMGGALVASQIELVIDEANRMIDSGVTVGKMKKEEMLSHVSQLMQKHFNIEGTTIRNGQIVMSGRIGMDESRGLNNPSRFGAASVVNFLEEASSTLGIQNFANSKIHMGNEAFGIADVYDWENDMGATWDYRYNDAGQRIRVDSTGGLVRWGYKEAEAVKHRASRYLGGSDNVVSKWLGSHMDEVARAQNQGVEQFAKGLISATLDITDRGVQSGKLKNGEVVIRTRGDSFSVDGAVDDREGRRTGRVRSDGVVEVSMNAFKDVGDLPYKGYERTVGDYQGSLIQMHQAEVDLYKDGQKQAGSFADALKANGGTALFELPDDSLGRKYVRFIDDKIARIAMNSEDDMPVINELQRAQMNIVEATKNYQKEISPENRVKLGNAVQDYENHVGYLLSSSRKGSISDKLFSSRLDMSGRFRVQTINPVNAGGYKEGSLYISEERMASMISGAEKNIATDVFKMDVAGMNSKQIQSSVLAKIKEEGLYGFVNRYPTIHESTNAVLNVRIDENLKGKKTGMMTVGTATVMNADSDGDFISNVFAHYKSQNAGEIHQALGTIHNKSLDDFNMVGKEVMSELVAEADKRNLTVGELWKDEEFRGKYNEFFESKTGSKYDLQTTIARLGKGDVGILDNTRERLSQFTNAIHNVLEQNGRISSEEALLRRDHIEEFGRLVSQKAISSKKFDGNVDGRDKALQMLRQGISNPDEAGVSLIRQANDLLGVFDTSSDFSDNPSANFGRHDQRFSLDSMLGTLQSDYELAGKPKNWTGSNLLKMVMSDGFATGTAASDFINGRAGVVAGTPMMERFMQLDDRLRDSLTDPQGYFSNMVLSNHDQATGAATNPFSSLSSGGPAVQVDEMLDGTASTKAVGQVRDMASKFMGGFGGGGGNGFAAMRTAGMMFAGMWGASALLRGGPTPEETVRGKDGVIEAANAPVNGSAMGMVKNGPTARITPNGETINISINAKDASSMGHEQVSALVQQELAGMMPMQLNMNTTVQDNTQNIDQQYLQGLVAQALNGRII